MGIILRLQVALGMALLVSTLALISMVFIAANSVTGTAETREIYDVGSGIIECIGGKSLTMNMKLHMIENPIGIVSGTIMVIDKNHALTAGAISEGHIANENFLLVSIDPKSLDHVPICHAGEDPNQIQVKGIIGNNTVIEFTSTCNNVEEEGVECVNAKGNFNASVTITSSLR